MSLSVQITVVYNIRLFSVLQPKPYDYEYSELIMYQCSVLEEAGRYQDALTHLDKFDKDIVDKLYLQESRARLHQLKEDNSTALTLYKGETLI